MKCMCAQTRPRFILSSERVFGGMEFEPMLTPREKSPLPENVPRGGLNPRRCGQRAQALPNELFWPPILELIEEKYLQAVGLVITHTDGSVEDAVKNGGSDMFVRTPAAQAISYAYATGRKCTNFKAEISAFQTAVAYITEIKPQKTVILKDSQAVLPLTRPSANC